MRYFPRFDDILQSTFCISVLSNMGSCFVCRLDNARIVIITCKHMFPDANNGDVVDFQFIRHNNVKDNFSGKLLYSEAHHGDICAVIVDDSKFLCAVQFQSIEILADLCIGDEVFVLGFPFIMKSKVFSPEPMFVGDAIYPQAILRHGYVASASVSNNGARHILLDLHNNPGFSGGPIIKKGRLFGTMDFGYVPVGVMGGYYCDEVDGKIESDTNSGISYGCPFSIIWQQLMNYSLHEGEENK